MALLEIETLSVDLGSIEVIDNLSLAVAPGEAVGIFGPNGSGKSTLLNAICGLVPMAAGAIRLEGKTISHRAPHEIAQAGIARSLQAPRVLARMTVRDNVRPLIGPDSEAEIDAIVAQVGLARHADDLAGSLALMDIRRLEVARLAAVRPRLALLDEPTAGLGPGERAQIIELIRALLLPSAATIIVEHHLEVLDQLCPRAVVLDGGRKIADGPIASVKADSAVRRAYLGTP